MTIDRAVDEIMSITKTAAGVPVYHAPSPSAGEKVIYRCTAGKYDGEFETFTVTMRFISAHTKDALRRAEAVSASLCFPGDHGGYRVDDDTLYITREDGGTSGYIGKTGYFYALARFQVRRRVSMPIRYGEASVYDG